MKVLIMCKSLTNAQRGVLLLERRGISASVVKSPQNLRVGGCGYAISLFRRLQEAAAILRDSGLLSGKIYYRSEDGEYLEVGEHDLS